MEKLTHSLWKAGVHAGGTSAATYLQWGAANVETPFGEKPLWMVAAGLGASSSVISDLIHTYIFPELPVNKKTNHDVSMVTSAVVSGLVYSYGLGFIDPRLPNEYGKLQSMAVGASAEVASTIALDMLGGM